MLLLLFLTLSESTCLTSGCTSNAQCSTCKTAATHGIWVQFDVSFVCNSTTTSCMPDITTGNASSTVIANACSQRQTTCCLHQNGTTVNAALCNAKTCLVNNGCSPVGQCDIPNMSNYRSDRSNCCNSDSGCKPTPGQCNVERCIVNSCSNTTRFSGCCDGNTPCPSSPTATCLRTACVPDDFNPGFNSCKNGIDSGCACTSNSDCNDGNICSTNTCDILTGRCTSSFFASSGGTSCCQNDVSAPLTCTNGNPCRNIIGCSDQPIVVNSSLTFLPTYACISRQEESIGCCTATPQCENLQLSTGSPCIDSTCNFGSNTCDLPANYFSISANQTLPCCRDSVDCEPTGQDGVRCQYLKCNNPEFQATITQSYFTCSQQTLSGTCTESGVITTNAQTSMMRIDGNCSWSCGQPGANVIKLLAKISNPSSGPGFISPLYLYNVTVRMTNNAPVLSGIVSSISMLPVSPYVPASRFVSPNLFAITRNSTESGGVYLQQFSLNSPTSMPIYPDEELTVQIIITLRTNATALTSTRVHLDINPYDICTPSLAAGGVSGIDTTPCNIASFPPSGHLGNILPRPIVGNASIILNFPSNCSVPCSSVATTSKTASTASTTASGRTATSTATAPTVTVPPAPSGTGVSGMAFYDLAEDGFNNFPSDPFVTNVRINAQSQTNASDFYTTTTNGIGEYSFSVVPKSPYYLMVVNSTIPFGYRPTIVIDNNLSPRKNQFSAATLRTIARSQSFQYIGVDLGLAKIPPCTRATPPPGVTGGLQIQFKSSATTCVACGSLINLRSRCTPTKCSGLMTRQFLEVEATVSNTAALPLGFNTLLLRLNSIGVGPTDADNRPYVCAEAFSVNSSNAYTLNSVPANDFSMASIAYGWNTIAVGVDVVRVRAQFLYCASDVITNFNVTAEILDTPCIENIRDWNRCDPTIDIRQCQATLRHAIPTCAGCPPTLAPTPSPNQQLPTPPTNLILTAFPYCFDALCVNSQTFTQLGCRNVSAEMARCTAADQRGEVLHQISIINPVSLPTSEPGLVVVKYKRNAINDEQLVCGEQFGNRVPILVILRSFDSNKTVVVDRHENAQQQSAQFSVTFPPIPAGEVVMISIVSFECSQFSLNYTVSAELITDRCNDDAICKKTVGSITDFDSCVRYRNSGCTETIEGDVVDGFGADEESGTPAAELVLPYVIVTGILLLLICVFCAAILFVRRRRQVEVERANKRFIANRNLNVEYRSMQNGAVRKLNR